jgi:hypothetical protein
MSSIQKKAEMPGYLDLIDEKWRNDSALDKLVVCDSARPSAALEMLMNQNILHICQSDNPYFEQDLNSSAMLLNDVDSFARFPASSILCPRELSEQKENSLILMDYRFDRVSQKQEILSKLESTLAGTGASSSIRADILLIADELSTNAIFNAPFVDLENTSPGASRDDQSIKMNDGRTARFFIAADDSRFVVGCCDPYGTLNINKMLSRIKDCYDAGVSANIRMAGNGGAGIGSFMVFNSAASYYVGVAVGEYTMVCCTLPIKMSNRARQEMPKNLHLIKKK